MSRFCAPGNVWWCYNCAEEVPDVCVTYNEKHAPTSGGCGEKVYEVPKRPSGRVGLLNKGMGGGATDPGLKYDTDKPPVDLLETAYLEEVAKVLAFGAEKYERHNWRRGISVTRNLAAALRHVFRVLRGEDIDPESGLHHLAHAGCCLMFAWWTLAEKPEFDDRWKEEDDE